MACIYNSGWSLSDNCLDNIGGVKEFYIGNFSGGSTYSYDADGIITGGTAQPTYYTIEQRREQGSFNQGGALTLDTGANVYTQSAQMVFFKYQASARDLVRIMAQTETSIIVLTQEGRYILLGEENGMNLISSEGGSGQKFEDLNGFRVNFEGKEKLPARELSSTFFGTLTVS